MYVWKAMLRMFMQQQVIHREFWLMLALNGVLPVIVPLLAWMALADSIGGIAIDGWNTESFTQYYLLNFFVYTLAYTSIHHEIGNLVRTGQMSYWILRPLHFFEFTLSYSLSRLLVMSAFCAFTAFLLHVTGIAVFTALQLRIAVTVFPGAVLLLVLIQILIGNLAFWLVECDGAFAAILLFLQFFGGLILPLGLFPSWITPISTVLPLRFAFGLPVEAIVKSSFADISVILTGQAGWIAVLLVVSSLLWRSGLRHYDAVGA